MEIWRLLSFCLMVQLSTIECTNPVRAADDDNVCNCRCEVNIKYGWFVDFTPPCCQCLVKKCPCFLDFVAETRVAFCLPCGCECGYTYRNYSNRAVCKPCGCSCGICDNEDGSVRCCTCSPPPPPSCFPSMARVSLENGKSVRMSELQKGDRVQTVSSTGIVRFSEVKTFLKRQYTMRVMYKSIRTACTTINLSGKHLIYARKDNENKFNPIYADEVKIDDEILVQESNELIPTKVTNVSNLVMEGAFTPLTMESNIMVDDVLASCYAVPYHDLAHIGMTPICWFPEATEWIFGDNHGSPVFAETTAFVARMIMPFELN